MMIWKRRAISGHESFARDWTTDQQYTHDDV